jgi:hypothetical protein
MGVKGRGLLYEDDPMAKQNKPEEPTYELDPNAALDTAPELSSLDRLAAAMEQMARVQLMMMEKGQQPDEEHKSILKGLSEAMERVSQNQLKGADAIAQSYRQVHRPSNEVVHERSAFHPRGNPSLNPDYDKPILRCSCWVPRPEEPGDNMLTREETELLNILVDCPGAYVVTRIDDTKMKVQVVVERGADDVTPSRLIMKSDTGFNNEYFRLLPSLHGQLRQIFAQHSDPDIRKRATEVMTMGEEALLIKAGKLSVAA